MSNDLILLPHKLPEDWKTWAITADLQCGLHVGLSPEPKNIIQERLLRRWEDAIAWFGRKPNVLLVVGDITQGVDPRWLANLNNEDLFTGVTGGDTQVPEQIQKAARLLAMWDAVDEYILVTGTRSHSTVAYQNLEPLVATALEAEIFKTSGKIPKVSVRRKLKTKINDWFILEARHFIGRSVIPHGRSTAPTRSQMWNVLNAAIKSYEEEKPIEYPQILIFAHVHYYNYTENAWGATLICPSWQALGDPYGDEMMDGHVDLGVVKLVVGPDKESSWGKATRLYSASLISRMESR